MSHSSQLSEAPYVGAQQKAHHYSDGVPLVWGLHKIQPNVVQVLELRTSYDGLGQTQHVVLGKTVLSYQLGGDGGNCLTLC